MSEGAVPVVVTPSSVVGGVPLDASSVVSPAVLVVALVLLSAALPPLVPAPVDDSERGASSSPQAHSIAATRTASPPPTRTRHRIAVGDRS
jgi:hypothetical protein